MTLQELSDYQNFVNELDRTKYIERLYKTHLLWKNFRHEKVSMEWYKENEPTFSPFVVSGDVAG